MGKTKLAAKIISSLSRLFAIGYFLVALYGAICLATKWCITPYGDGRFLHINYPLSQTPFLIVDNSGSYIFFSFLLPLTLYGLFFWLTANMFAAFSMEKLFTLQNLLQLKRFYLFNWLAAFPVILISSLFVEIENIVWLLAAVHSVLGVLTWMVAAIFQQGLLLQKEQELFI